MNFVVVVVVVEFVVVVVVTFVVEDYASVRPLSTRWCRSLSNHFHFKDTNSVTHMATMRRLTSRKWPTVLVLTSDSKM